MGAKARAWVNRGLVVLAVVAGAGLVLWLPAIPALGKIALLMTGAVVGAIVAFREIPAFDPLGRVHWRLPRWPQRACAITFDDGPSAHTRRVVEILGRQQVKATFFVLAANARRHPEVLRLVAEQGHTVAIHGVTHKKIHHASAASVEHELSTAIEQLTALGVAPARLYRAPHGLKNAATFKAARNLGCQVWAWSRGIWDTDRPDADILVRRATRFACSRMVLLLHDGRGDEEHPDIEPMLVALPNILERLRAHGFTFLTLDQLAENPQRVPGPSREGLRSAKPSSVHACVTHARWKSALRCLPLCLLAVVLWREKPWMVRFSASAPWAVMATILLNFAVYLPVKALRWRVALTDPPPFRQVLAATLEGLLANAAIGFGSGDVVRSARLRQQHQRVKGQLAVDYACTWAERGAEVLALALLVFVTALMMRLGTLALTLSGLAVAGYVAVLGAGRFLVPRLQRWPRVQRALSSGLQASTPRRVTSMAALSLLGWASEIVMLVLFQGAFHLAPSFQTALLTLVAINAAIVIPTLPGNFGTFEAGATMALVMCGAPRAVAVLYALTYHLTHVLPVAVVATTVYLIRSRGHAARATGPERQE
jgi:peptidoglycan/xylan/chitin deacetylase (PgdA/CDA1 family)/uncharacterized membrane protein YbhN (UPF0104 family)